MFYDDALQIVRCVNAYILRLFLYNGIVRNLFRCVPVYLITKMLISGPIKTSSQWWYAFKPSISVLNASEPKNTFNQATQRRNPI